VEWVNEGSGAEAAGFCGLSVYLNLFCCCSVGCLCQELQGVEVV
jgi:hypothetical protein